MMFTSNPHGVAGERTGTGTQGQPAVMPIEGPAVS